MVICYHPNPLLRPEALCLILLVSDTIVVVLENVPKCGLVGHLFSLPGVKHLQLTVVQLI